MSASGYHPFVVSIAVLRDPALNAPSGLVCASGAIWFTNIADHRIGRVRDGVVELFADPAGVVKLPANLFPGADGRVWFTSLGSDALGAIDPDAPDPAATIATFALPPGSRPVALKSGPDQRLWFSLRGAEAIGSLDPCAPSPADSVRLYRSPDIAEPAAVFVTSDGRVWWVNSATDTVGLLEPGSGDVTVIGDLPAGPRAWAQSPTGALWLTSREPAGLMSFDPADPAGTVRLVSDERLREPDGVWVGEDCVVWLVDSQANAVVRYDPAAQAWEFFGGPPDVEGPFDIEPGPDPAELWFTNKAGNSLGRISVAAQRD